MSIAQADSRSGESCYEPASSSYLFDLALAMCSENSIFVAGSILSDPFEEIADYDVRRIVGNIGWPGICMLIAPKDPKISPYPTSTSWFRMHSMMDKERITFVKPRYISPLQKESSSGL